MRIFLKNVGLFVLMFCAMPFWAWARDKDCRELRAAGDLKISFSECKELESNLGQLLYVFVNGPPHQSEIAIDPAYVKMIHDLQIGGVVPHPATYDPDKLRMSYATLQNATDLPLLIGADFHYL